MILQSTTDALLDKIPLWHPRRRARDVHSLGDLIAATARNRISIAVLLGVIALFLVGTTFAGLRGLLGVALLILVVAAGISLVLGRLARDWVAVFDEGVAWSRGGAPRTARWSDVAGWEALVEDVVQGASRSPRDEYRLVLKNGDAVAWNWDFEQHRVVGQACARRLGDATR